MNDPVADAKRVREWFACRSTALAWLFQPRIVPPGAWYLLYDEASLRIARRREFVWLWLPAILAMAFLALGCWVTIDYDVKVWYYDSADPEQKPLRVVHEEETDRLFTLNLHMFRGGLMFAKPASWVQVVERYRNRVHLSTPDAFDPMFVIWGCTPAVLVFFGCAPARAFAMRRAAHTTRNGGRPGRWQASRSAWALMAGPWGVATWLCLAALAVNTVGHLALPVDLEPYVYGWMVPGAVSLWGAASFVGIALLIGLDRARLVFPHRVIVWLALTVTSIAGPVAASWCLLAIFC